MKSTMCEMKTTLDKTNGRTEIEEKSSELEDIARETSKIRDKKRIKKMKRI